MRSRKMLFGLGIMVFLLSGCSNTSLVNSPSQTIEREMQSTQYSGEEKAFQNASLPLDQINLPEGFRISIFATNVPNARSLTLSDQGVLYVGTRNEGKVYALEDRDKNGRADRMDVIAEGLNSPNGVVWKDGDLYVAEIDRILKFSDIDTHRALSPEFEVIYVSLRYFFFHKKLKVVS